MSVVTFTKTPKSLVDPFTGGTENVVDVIPAVDGTDLLDERYLVAPTKTDAEIQQLLEHDLLAKGKFLGPVTTSEPTAVAGPPKFHATSKIVDGADVGTVVIEPGPAWQVLGGVVANPGFFTPNLPKVMGRVVGSVKAVGAGAELQVVEEDPVGGDVVLGTYVVPDSAGAWVVLKFSAMLAAPRAGDHTYRLEGRLNGATSMALRFTSLSMLEL